MFAAGLLARADIELMAMRPYLEASVRIAVALDHPAYDCVYIALAEAEEIRFVTADMSLLHKVGSRRPRAMSTACSAWPTPRHGRNRLAAKAPRH